MDEEKTPAGDVIVACEVCIKEVPISEAKSEEATDYVLYFCGLDCYAKWKKQGKQEPRGLMQD